jgi:hypothetical protein
MWEDVEMSFRSGVLLTVFLVCLAPLSAGAEATCDDGQVLRAGDRCEITIKWGYDHWVRAEFSEDGVSRVAFTHLEGDCNVALFGPVELEEIVLGPGQTPTELKLPGEYHLFTRAISVAQQTCRYAVSIE